MPWALSKGTYVHPFRFEHGVDQIVREGLSSRTAIQSLIVPFELNDLHPGLLLQICVHYYSPLGKSVAVLSALSIDFGLVLKK